MRLVADLPSAMPGTSTWFQLQTTPPPSQQSLIQPSLISSYMTRICPLFLLPLNWLHLRNQWIIFLGVKYFFKELWRVAHEIEGSRVAFRDSGIDRLDTGDGLFQLSNSKPLMATTTSLFQPCFLAQCLWLKMCVNTLNNNWAYWKTFFFLSDD